MLCRIENPLTKSWADRILGSEPSPAINPRVTDLVKRIIEPSRAKQAAALLCCAAHAALIQLRKDDVVTSL